MKHKLNKQKGFTLIELMVVIAIIALLSSVVLASLKGAREKAVLSKTVAEMKSLQNALELYKNQFGIYPGIYESPGLSFNDDDMNNSPAYATLYVSKDNEAFEYELVTRKFISKLPKSPNYPNNCGTDCITNGYTLGYSVNTPDGYFKDTFSYDFGFMCGDEKIKNYLIYFYANNKKINLPQLYTYLTFPDGSTDKWEFHYGYNTYCLSM